MFVQVLRIYYLKDQLHFIFLLLLFDQPFSLSILFDQLTTVSAMSTPSSSSSSSALPLKSRLNYYIIKNTRNTITQKPLTEVEKSVFKVLGNNNDYFFKNKRSHQQRWMKALTTTPTNSDTEIDSDEDYLQVRNRKIVKNYFLLVVLCIVVVSLAFGLYLYAFRKKRSKRVKIESIEIDLLPTYDEALQMRPSECAAESYTSSENYRLTNRNIGFSLSPLAPPILPPSPSMPSPPLPPSYNVALYTQKINLPTKV